MAELVDALSSDGSGYAIRVRLSLSAPRQTEFEPELYIRKRVCGFYR